jgi:hypothetical protein
LVAEPSASTAPEHRRRRAASSVGHRQPSEPQLEPDPFAKIAPLRQRHHSLVYDQDLRLVTAAIAPCAAVIAKN